MKRQVVQIETFNKLWKLSMLVLFLLVGFSFQADAQRDRRDRDNDKNTEDYFDESGVGSFRFWYGGGIGLNFGSGFNTSQFNFSISPMVGYKITPEFSIGPRAELEYVHFRDSRSGNLQKFNFINYGIGAFTRYKFFQQFFGHAEYQIESRKFTDGSRESKNNFFLGGGYTSGGQVGYEIVILWNFLDDDTLDVPLDYRIAFTYNF